MATYFGEEKLWPSELRCQSCGEVARDHEGQWRQGCKDFCRTNPPQYGRVVPR